MPATAPGSYPSTRKVETSRTRSAISMRELFSIVPNAMTPAKSRATWMDVAPTALHLLGLAVPRDCDGRVLLELLDSEGPGGRTPRYRDLAAHGPAGD